jgi:hypothetical protein
MHYYAYVFSEVCVKKTSRENYMFSICPTICSTSNFMMNDTMTRRRQFFHVVKCIPLLCIYNIYISYSRQMDASYAGYQILRNDLRSNSRRVICHVQSCFMLYAHMYKGQETDILSSIIIIFFLFHFRIYWEACNFIIIFNFT